jgi:DNA (cytosine-5)-methyltransferase 1
MKLIELPRPQGIRAETWAAWNRMQQRQLLEVLKAPRRMRKSGLRAMSWFCGAGGDSQALHCVPWLDLFLVANHWDRAIESHAANFPWVEHYKGDIREAPVDKWPVADFFWASPECPQWSNARGKRRDFAISMQDDLFGEIAPSEEVERSRALMEEVPQYLRGVQQRGGLVLAGVVENVIDVRAWDQWDRWLGEIKALGYKTRVIALNSMHADPRTVLKAPQSRDRLYVAYWHRSLGRDPEWDKWLRPRAWCPTCDEQVNAMQVFKIPGRDMGRYRQQYVYRCPRTTCRNEIIEPHVLPAAVAIDWNLPGQRIGDRTKPLAEKTLARIQAGLDRYARPVPMMVPAGGTWRNDAVSVGEPMATRTTRENDGLAVPPLLIPVEGRDGKEPASAHVPLRTQTARNETGLAWLPYMVELRGGSSDARSILDPTASVTASGNHLGVAAREWPAAMVMRNNTVRSGDAGYLCTPIEDPVRALTAAGHQSLVTWEHLLVPYYGNGTAKTVREPIGTLSTRDRYALVQGDVDINDVLFRMLEPHEIGRAMSFGDDYIVLGSKRERVRQYGNAVTPPAAEVIACALVEAITGEEIDRYAEPGLAVAS